MYRHTEGLLLEEKPPTSLLDFPKPYTELDFWGNGAAHGYLEDVLTNLYSALRFDSILKKKGTHQFAVIRTDSDPNIVVVTIKIFIE
jgi:hypothetical protein